ncbi:MAG: hypothetical protein U5N58_04260 [Actinomycetota bacterium]|nr:hypothetical protein [Actinomycetota bacterium]
MVNPKFAYFEGKIVPRSEAKVDIRTNSLQYGTAVFEGIRSYWNQGQQKNYVFRMQDHYQRLLESGRILMIDLDKSIQQLSEITIELLKKEDYHEDILYQALRL